MYRGDSRSPFALAIPTSSAISPTIPPTKSSTLTRGVCIAFTLRITTDAATTRPSINLSLAEETKPTESRLLAPQDRSSRKKSEITLLLCVFHSTSEHWSTCPVRFNPNRINDRQLWTQIRYAFRTDLQKPWRRILGFKKVKNIVPIGFTPNGVPTKTNPKDFRDAKTFMHAYHHPERIRPDHRWVDWFVEFDASETRQNGLEFVEGLWAEKLAIVAVICSIAIIVISIVWCALGGNLQTVFSVMGFVLTLIAAQIALVALYYQVATPSG